MTSKETKLEQLKTLDITFKSVLLKPQKGEPSKLLLGVKFKPRDDISLEAKKAIEAMIRNGEHLKQFADFVSGKISSDYTLRKLIELLGWSCCKFMLSRSKAGVYETQQRELAKSLYVYLNALKKGWIEATQDGK